LREGCIQHRSTLHEKQNEVEVMALGNRPDLHTRRQVKLIDKVFGSVDEGDIEVGLDSQLPY
jgi:hypothetical protein